MAAVRPITGMGAEQRSLRDRPRNRPENDQRGNGPHFELSEMVAAHAANCRQIARPTSARGVRKQPSKTIHYKCVLIDAGCGPQARLFVARAMPRQDAVAVCLAAKRKTDRLRISNYQ